MQILVVFLGCVALAYARCCSPGDAEVVISQWAGVMNAGLAGSSKTAVGNAIFSRLFSKQPGAPALFPDGGDLGSAGMIAQESRVVAGIDLCINSLQNQAVLNSILGHLNSQHSAIGGVSSAAIGSMGESIAEVMGQLIPGYNGDAWASCLDRIVAGVGAGL